MIQVALKRIIIKIVILISDVFFLNDTKLFCFLDENKFNCSIITSKLVNRVDKAIAAAATADDAAFL